MGSMEKFLSLYQSKSTIGAYRNGLNVYFSFIYGKSGQLEEKADKYLSDKRNIEGDLANFQNSLKGRPPKTINLYITAIRTFLIENNIELSQAFWKRLGRRRGRSNRARTLDKVPSNKELKTILSHMPIQGKSLYLLLSSTGMRIGEALKLQLEDIDLENNHITIRGENTKTGTSRHAFFSTEAKEYLAEWLKNRARYLEQATGRSARFVKNAEDNHLFPFNQNTAYFMWKTSLEKSGNGQKDRSTNRRVFHPHVLRKFFRTRMGSVIPVDVVEALMGHEGYLTEVYRKYATEDLAKFYKQGEYALQVFGADIEEISKVREEIKEDRDNLQRIVNGLTAENLEMMNNIRQLRTEAQEEKTLREKNNDLFTEQLEKQLRNVAEAKKDIEILKQHIFSLEEEEPRPKDNLFP